MDWGFILEVELQVWQGMDVGGVGVAGFKDASQFSGLSNWAGRWLPFPEMGRHREEQVGEEIKSLLLDMLSLSYYLSCLFIADRAPWVSEVQEGQKEALTQKRPWPMAPLERCFSHFKRFHLFIFGCVCCLWHTGFLGRMRSQ